MPGPQTFNFTTGPSPLPDVGVLSYNGCVFSPLFVTNVAGNAIKDQARRTVMYMEYVIIADGYVTLTQNSASINQTMVSMITLLTQQGGHLVYEGRGFNLSVNSPGSRLRTAAQDVAWGPVPELIEFQPLGGGRSAKVVWKVTVRIVPPRNSLGRIGIGADSAGNLIDLLQFNFDTSVSYSDDFFSTINVRGTMEIPLNRFSVGNRQVPITVDRFRSELDSRIFASIDLNRYRIVRREFNVSRDKRVMEFNISAEEKPYMDLPPNHSVARGVYSVKPARSGMGLVLWLCTLRATYTVVNGLPRRNAWFAYLWLLRERMSASLLANVGGLNGLPQPQNPPNPPNVQFGGVPVIAWHLNGWNALFNRQGQGQGQGNLLNGGSRAWLIDFAYDEGLYLDSKTISFSATWRLVTTFSHILEASGIWKKIRENNAGQNLWVQSIESVTRSAGPLPNYATPDVIVDFGGG